MPITFTGTKIDFSGKFGPVPVIKISCFSIELKESVDVLKKYQFVENRYGWRNGFTEIRKLGKFRYFIRHVISDTWHVTNIENAEVYVKNFLRLDGY